MTKNEILEYFKDINHAYNDCTRYDSLKRMLDELQEPCTDAISREAVIDIIEDVCPIYGNDYRYILRDKVNELPPVNPAEKPSKWIPVSERLPEPYRFVNCTCHSLIDDREDWVIETIYVPLPFDNPYSDWGNIPMLNSGDCEVIAWMYRDIPKPYKASPTGEEGGMNEIYK